MWGGLWIALGILFLRGGLMACLTRQLSMSFQVAYLVTASLSCLIYAATTDRFVFQPSRGDQQQENRWPALGLSLIVYSVLLRLLFLGLPEILHEEGYYWN